QRLPNLRRVAQFMLETFRHAQGEVTIRIVSLPLMNETGTDLHAERSFVRPDKIITGTRAQNKPVIHIGDRIPHSFETDKTIHAVAQKPVILTESLDRFVVPDVFRFAVSSVR